MIYQPEESDDALLAKATFAVLMVFIMGCVIGFAACHYLNTVGG
jgi:hypothetical protein